MLKPILIAVALVLMPQMAVWAQTAPAARQVQPTYHPKGEVSANGRCDGLSYGTGARRCGSRSGGPVGGISGRN